MKNIKRFSICLFCVFTVISFAQDSEKTSKPRGIIRGRVVDSARAETPIEGVQIYVRSSTASATESDAPSAITDSNGEYKISGLPNGRYLLSAYKEGYGKREGRPVTVMPAGEHFVDLKMTKKDTIIDFFAKFGFVFWPLLICSVVAVTFIVERTFTFLRSRSKVGTEKFINKVTEALRNDKIMDAVSICEDAGGPLAHVLKAGLLRFSQAQIEGRKISKEEIQEAVQEQGLLEVPELERNLPVLSTIAVISPLFGLLGTVMGMISAFTTIALEGTGDPQELAGGISQALLTTAGGLAIAIPCLVFYNLFDSGVNRYVLQIEQTSTEVVNQLLMGQSGIKPGK